jgi:hypothetical protein
VSQPSLTSPPTPTRLSQRTMALPIGSQSTAEARTGHGGCLASSDFSHQCSALRMPIRPSRDVSYRAKERPAGSRFRCPRRGGSQQLHDPTTAQQPRTEEASRPESVLRWVKALAGGTQMSSCVHTRRGRPGCSTDSVLAVASASFVTQVLLGVSLLMSPMMIR